MFGLDGARRIFDLSSKEDSEESLGRAWEERVRRNQSEMGFLGVSCNLRDRQAGPAGLDFGGRRNVLHWKSCSSSPPRSRLGGQSKRSVWDRLSLHFPPLGSYIFHTHTHTHTVNTNPCHYITQSI